MPKAYSVVTYHGIKDPERFKRYAALAGPSLEGQGARFLARGMPEAVYEAGKSERVVIIEFDSVEAARAAYESESYQEAMEALGDAATRDYRIVPGA